MAKLKEKATGREFYFMVNHLYRSKAARRHMQATLLNDWASRQALPVIAVGDYNFDWSVTRGEADHDEGYDHMTANGVYEWVRPATLVKTQDSRFNNVLDFVFVLREARRWALSSTILTAPNDFSGTNKTSDHRPVRARFDLSKLEKVTKQEVLARIKGLQKKLEAVRSLVEQLP